MEVNPSIHKTEQGGGSRSLASIGAGANERMNKHKRTLSWISPIILEIILL